MRQARFELLEDGTFYGSIPGFEGVWANAPTEEECRQELQEVLEEWIIFRLKHDLPLPVVGDLDLNRIAA